MRESLMTLSALLHTRYVAETTTRRTTLQNNSAVDDWLNEKRFRQQLASQIISYAFVATVLILIFVYTTHLIETYRKSDYFRLEE